MSYPMDLPERDPRYVTPMGYDPREDLAICDDCEAGECWNCNTTAWSDVVNFPCVCDCFKADHNIQGDK